MLRNRLITLSSRIVSLITTGLFLGVASGVQASGSIGPPTPEPSCSPGVLVKCLPANSSFMAYMATLLRDNTILILTVASLLIVVSGVQYILAMGNSGDQAKAKQRIVGIVVGIIFFTLIQFTLTLIAADLRTSA